MRIAPVHFVCRFARPHSSLDKLDACLPCLLAFAPRPPKRLATMPLINYERGSEPRYPKRFSNQSGCGTAVLITAKTIVCRMHAEGGPFLRCSCFACLCRRESTCCGIPFGRRRTGCGMNDCLRAPSIHPPWKNIAQWGYGNEASDSKNQVQTLCLEQLVGAAGHKVPE